MSRTSFLVDGFNLYHSLKKAETVLGGRGTRWLDLKALCVSYLQAMGTAARLESVHYFSALAFHMEQAKPGVTARHQTYIDCLTASGVIVELSKFKMKTSACRHCGRAIVRYEEKETDVAIGVRLLDRSRQGVKPTEYGPVTTASKYSMCCRSASSSSPEWTEFARNSCSTSSGTSPPG